MPSFDLNIEKVLEDWGVRHALREIIANAIDEQQLTGTPDIEIFKDSDGFWHIKDFGRGLQYTHLTQNENAEKLDNPEKVIGKFGVGLKDALATFSRNGVNVTIQSKHNEITLGEASKHGFEDVVTLHAFIEPSSSPEMDGTEFILIGVPDSEVEAAKEFFLMFSDEEPLEKTPFGEVLQQGHGGARIFINGLRVAEEENFLFSYNITSVTATIRKALNRERTNVGRTAYTGRVKEILQRCESEVVAEALVKDLQRYEKGDSHDELSWVDVAVHACKLLNAQGKVVFVTPADTFTTGDAIDSAISDGYRIVTVPQNVKSKLTETIDLTGAPIRDLEQYIEEFNDSFDFQFVDEDDLTEQENQVYGYREAIMDFIGGKPRKVKQVLISETMRLGEDTGRETLGVWEEHNKRIVIKRTQLKSLELFAGTLLHECAHATSGAGDACRDFESELTRFLGLCSAQSLKPVLTKTL